MELIKITFYEHKRRYGYRRITLELRNKGIVINHKKVKRLMTKMNLFGLKAKSKYKSYKGNLNGTCRNYLLDKVVDEEKHTTTFKQNFITHKCKEKWATDVTEFHIAAGKVYLSPIIDMHSREIIAYNISKTPNFKQITEMLDQVSRQHSDVQGVILHSDQGWQYQMKAYREWLSDRKMIQSMSRKGNCLDNSPIENFFGILKREMFYGNEFKFKTRDELIRAITNYIDYYNNKRISLKLKGLTPVQYRNQSS